MIIHTLALFISQLHCRDTCARPALQNNENENMSWIARTKGVRAEGVKDTSCALIVVKEGDVNKRPGS